MSFGAGAGGFSFGNNSTSAFGNSTSMFGGNKTTPGFGSTSNTGGSLFGNTANTGTGAFGTSTGGFGTTNTTSSPFGGGMTSTFGGFGSNTNNSSTSGPFGSTPNKTLFGAAGAGTTSGFGTTGGAFGNANNPVGPVPPCQGTGNVQFQPVEEKETNGTVSRYQTISTMEPYQKYSLEELRLADYNGGRQYGNGTGTAGAFGQTNFSGFGSTANAGGTFGSTPSTSGGLFGNNSTSGNAFGSGTATSGGFGTNTNVGGGVFGNTSSTGGGLFNKPATGGLFGNSSTPTTNTGGLFGQTNTASTGFGNAQSGSLFGNNTQNKPGGIFGNAASTNTGGGLFGQNNQQTSAPATGGLFGTSNNTSGGLFGNNNQQQNTGGLFGNSNNTQQSEGLFGNKTGTGFGTTTQAQSTTGLFGSTNNTQQSGGLLGSTQNQSGGLFGNNTANTGGGLFGNQSQNKPGGLFGNTSTNNQGGGLFSTSNNQQQNNTGGGLFGNQNQNKPGGLFGSTSTNNQGGGLFGTTNNQQQNNTGGGLFGNQTQNKPGGLFGNTSTNNQSGGLFASNPTGGLFGNSQMNQSQQQNPNQQEVKHASLLDPNPYGQSSIWTGLPTPNEQNSKPLFTPLTATKKMQESAMKPLPTLRLNQSRYMTPPRRGGYGLNYSTYGTPSSVASTPGAGPLSGSLYASRGWSGGGSFGRSFNRSSSVQNLRSIYGNDSDDIWKPNAFAPSHRNSSGSIKRLTIDKSIRTDLFNRPSPVPALPAPKPVNNGEANSSPAQSQPSEPATDSTRKLSKRVSWSDNAAEPSLNAETGALVRTEDSDEEQSQPARNGASKNLQAVPEDSESHQVSEQAASVEDREIGKYWMKPSRQELSRMSRNDLKSFRDFRVGREGCGHVTFNFPLDLTKIDFDNLYGGLIDITTRAITVYPDKSAKPPMGQGLNVPSTLVIDNSWPRRGKKQPCADSSGPYYEKHIQRLKRVPNTNFVSYNAATGTWTFTVDHYTRYGLDYDDESEMDQSELSLPPQNLEKSADASVMEVDSPTDSDFQDDDTFDFKRLPGQFDNKSGIPIDSESESAGGEGEMTDGSDLSGHSETEYLSEEELSSPSMPGALPANDEFLFSPIKPSIKGLTVPGTPGKALLDLDGDWAEQLQKTISPRKQNRDVLREAQSKIALDQAFSPIKPKPAAQVNFKSSVDIMNAIFKPAKGTRNAQPTEPDFEV